MIHMTEPVPGGGSFGGLAPLLTTPLPTFSNSGPNYRTVRQKVITNCPLVALLAALAHAMPGTLQRMVSKPKTVTQRMWHYQEIQPLPPLPAPLAPKPGPRSPSDPGIASDTIITVQFPKKTVEISPRLYLESNSSDRTNIVPRFAAATDGSGWVSYIEKAYVVFRGENLYRNLNLLGQTTSPLSVERIIDDVAFDFDFFDLRTRELWKDPEFVLPNPPVKDDPRTTIIPHDPIQVEDEARQVETYSQSGSMRKLRALLAEHARRATLATTHNHTLAVVGFDRTHNLVRLFDAMRGTERVANLADFVQHHDRVYQVRH